MKPGHAFSTPAIACLLALQACNTDPAKDVPAVTGQKGIIISVDGKPVAGATVSFYPVDQIPKHALLNEAGSSQPAALAQTDGNGEYRMDSLPAGLYNVFARLADLSSYRDSVAVTSGSQELLSDTLRMPGKIQGRINLEPQHDPRFVAILVLGSGVTSQADGQGNFSLEGLAPGDYCIRLVSTIEGYLPMEYVASLKASGDSRIPDTLTLPYTGLPVVRGLRILFDTVTGVTGLTWRKSDFTGLAGYRVYRAKRSPGSGVLSEAILVGAVKDTVFHDSLAISLPGFEKDTVGVEFAYSVKAVNKVGEPGPSLEPIMVGAVGSARIATLITLEFLRPSSGGDSVRAFFTLPDTLSSGDRAASAETLSIGDTCRVIAGFRNQGRKIRSVSWSYRYGKELYRKPYSTNSGLDTLRHARITPGADTLRLTVTDDGGRDRKTDFILRTVSDPPRAEAGGPVKVFLGDTITLVGKAKDSNDVIVRFEWDIGNTGSFQEAKAGRILVTAPDSLSAGIPCVLRVTDRQGETGLDTLILQVVRGKMLAPMKAWREMHGLEAVGGKLYAIGSKYMDVAHTLEVYDPIADTWKPGPQIPTPRIRNGTAVLDGKIYVIGGQRVEYYPEVNKYQAKDYTLAVNVFDPSSGAWTQAAPLPQGFFEIHAAAAHAGKLYVQGVLWPNFTDGFFEYNPSDDTWRILPMLPDVPEALLSLGDRFFSVKANSGTIYVNEFNLATNTYTPRKSLSKRGSTIKACVAGSRLYVVGGISGTDFQSSSGSVDAYDPETDEWSYGGELRVPRVNHAIAVFNGEIFVNGGVYLHKVSGSDINGREALVQMEKFRP